MAVRTQLAKQLFCHSVPTHKGNASAAANRHWLQREMRSILLQVLGRM